VYCGFRYPQQIVRRHLSLEEAIREAEVLGARGFRHILLVAGDFPRLTTVDYYAGVIGALAARGFHPTVEIAPQAADDYARLRAGGACGVTLYQETYDETHYRRYHPRGTKASFDWRLEGLDRAAEAGMTRLGLGILLGLADPRQDLVALMRHGGYLQSRFPDRALAFSLPRIREAPDAFQAPHEIDDRAFVRFYCALRIAFPQAELVLSTRESPALRDQLAGICITQLSAGSSTTPGGYVDASAAEPLGRQFPVCDHRSPAQVAERLREMGFELLWDLAD
jgi:2-iminoacetate synthase